MLENFDFLQLNSVRGRLPLIVYELNEVPWRIVDWYIGQRPQSNLANMLKRSLTFTTMTHDSGELHPWTTWPTVHRGVYNEQHQIRFLNQDLSVAKDYPPIWEVLSKKGYKVGVFGSLQSYPVPSSGAYSFYVPDTFARSPETHPARYSAFQRINLRQTASDGAIPSEVKLGGVMFDVARLPFVGVSPATFVKLAQQLRNERKDQQYRARRPMFQAPLAFDVFLDAYKKTKPQFSTFFTNHVAGTMHRYWRYVFPEDFDATNEAPGDQFKSDTVLEAMDIADEQIGRLAHLALQDGGTLLVLSSMGQEAVKLDPYHGELRITETQKLADAIGFKHPFRANLAMQPDFNFEFDSEDAAQEFLDRVLALRDHEGRLIWYRRRRQGASVNVALGMPQSMLEKESAVFDFEGKSSVISLADLGIKKIYRDPGTGYHQPKGIMIWHGKDTAARDDSRSIIESAWIKDMILHAVAATEVSRAAA